MTAFSLHEAWKLKLHREELKYHVLLVTEHHCELVQVKGIYSPGKFINVPLKASLHVWFSFHSSQVILIRGNLRFFFNLGSVLYVFLST